ncbi:iron-containing alcohol dehydrogenase [Sediminibacterium roseum]|uniref:Iron-containing alcohol dehydrogenase n=1 Tax=Sediminibacterium roseum TaxID=1978412 RepID=A0ABW9ZW02_9BACT|nr:iron-containing alcohol dehydrogenase family protein [Sediminibacterium roseum]NCI49056.1 iron-containing alcohol dehydrogenase [Sediminibacterium roseum]
METTFRIFKQVPRLIFGAGSLRRIGELVPPKNEGDYYVYVIDDVLKNGVVEDSLSIDENDLVEWFPATRKEPSTIQVDELRDKVIKEKAGKMPLCIIGIGGGSTMDVGKALSVMLCNEGSSRVYQGWDLVANPGIFKIGVPSIAGSGAEASRTAVLMGADRKFGINSDHSMFNAIIMDSSLIKTVKKDQWFYSGMDCFIHCVESLEGTMINELARGYADKALELCKRVFMGNGDDDMLMTASYMGGVSIVNSEVGVCHALSYGLSIELEYRHGYANCIAFNVLDEYYGKHVASFREMLKRHDIQLSTNVCSNLDDSAMNRMIDMTLRMERPLTNALGENWKAILTRDKIRELYLKM